MLSILINFLGVVAFLALIIAILYALVSGAVIVLNATSLLFIRLSQYIAYMVYIVSFGKIRLFVSNDSSGIFATNVPTQTKSKSQPATPPPQQLHNNSGDKQRSQPHQQQQAGKPQQQHTPKAAPAETNFWGQFSKTVNCYLERVEEEHTQRLKHLEKDRQEIASGNPSPNSQAVQDLQRTMQSIQQKLHNMENNTSGNAGTNALNNIHQKLNTLSNEMQKSHQHTQNELRKLTERVDEVQEDVNTMYKESASQPMFK